MKGIILLLEKTIWETFFRSFIEKGPMIEPFYHRTLSMNAYRPLRVQSARNNKPSVYDSGIATIQYNLPFSFYSADTHQ